MKNEISQPWKVYDEINTVLEYMALKRTHQKKLQMRRRRNRQKWQSRASPRMTTR